MNKDPDEDQYNPEDNTGKIKGNQEYTDGTKF